MLVNKLIHTSPKDCKQETKLQMYAFKDFIEKQNTDCKNLYIPFITIAYKISCGVTSNHVKSTFRKSLQP